MKKRHVEMMIKALNDKQINHTLKVEEKKAIIADINYLFGYSAGRGWKLNIDNDKPCTCGCENIPF